MNSIIFCARGLTVTYGPRHALTDVDVSIPRGTSAALVGANGSGKSTLLNVMAGLVEPTGGTVENEAASVAYVLQYGGRGAWMPLTVEEVVAMGRFPHRRPWQRSTDADRDAIDTACARLGVDDLRSRQFGELSGGQRQRVLVAQALTIQADLLLMDEPITGLDMPSQDRILEVIEAETSAGATVVLSTHHLDEAHHCDLVVLLAGTVVAAGTPSEVLTPETLRLAYDSHMFGAHADHDHPAGVLLIDEHGHDHDHGDHRHRHPPADPPPGSG